MLSKKLITAWVEVAYGAAEIDPKNRFDLRRTEFDRYLTKVFQEKDFEGVEVKNLIANYVRLARRFNADITGEAPRKTVIAKHCLTALNGMARAMS